MTEENLTFAWDSLPQATADLPGTGGRIRVQPGDFIVREIPAYLPEGNGSHAYALVRKTGLTTRELVQCLQSAGLEEKSIGVAGLKDKYAVTEQWLSVPQAKSAAFNRLAELPGVEILERSRHRNKLAIGHLHGNRFIINIREVGESALDHARAIVAKLTEHGLPNYFGPQRFGRYGRNAVDGLKVIRGEEVPGGHRLKRFFQSALQSQLFNRLLALRLENDLFETVVLGDWARKHDTGGTFEVRDENEADRARRLEISATLPLYGKKVKVSNARAGELEEQVLEEFGLRWIEFRSRHGDRRLSRLRLDEVLVEAPEAGVLRLEFALPKGSYATSLLREVMKTEVDEPMAENEGSEEAGPEED